MKTLIVRLSAAALGCLAAFSATAGTLDQVKARGALICGVGTGLAGFGLPDVSGRLEGP